MDIQQLTPDQVVFWSWGLVSINATLVFTWAIMLLLVGGSWLATRNLSGDPPLSRWQNLLEIVVDGIRQQIRDVSQRQPDKFLPFIGTLFIFIVVSNLLAVVPGYVAPTASLSTTTALAICVFIAVPWYGIRDQGFGQYLRNYLQPTVFMLPFNVIGELSRTLALAVRLFGNIMSGAKIAAIFLALAPLIFPIFMQVLGLLTGLIQAYIFAILAIVYIAAALRVREKKQPEKKQKGDNSYG
ncbi:MAG: F0F1 ATP synthase subunit A [Pseudomonadota bacterium]|nr:F0F1 ATP synthase subunit A [Pseudomonadota bacterium]